MKSFRICHIGCGGMSIRGHGPALAKYAFDYPMTELAGCCDIDEEKAVKFKKMYGFKKAFTEWESMLDEIKPDAVSLAVPVQYTAEISSKIARRGFNLLTEKPPGMTKKQCLQIVDAVEESGIKAVAAFNRRYMPITKILLDMTKNIKIEHINYNFFRTGRKDKDFSTTAIHGIDTVRAIAGSDYKTIDIYYQKLKSTPVGNIFINGVMESNTVVSVNFYPDSGLVAERVEIISEGEIFFLKIPIWDCPDYPGEILHYRMGHLVNVIKGTSKSMFIANGFYDEHRDFYEAVRTGTDIHNKIIDSLQSVEIMEQIRQGNNT